MRVLRYVLAGKACTAFAPLAVPPTLPLIVIGRLGCESERVAPQPQPGLRIRIGRGLPHTAVLEKVTTLNRRAELALRQPGWLYSASAGSLASVIFPAALPLTIRSTANKPVGMITGWLEKLLAAATAAITHQAAPNRDASRSLCAHQFPGCEAQRHGTENRPALTFRPHHILSGL